ncbi:MAG: IS701 family transposase [Haloarculaceae archaeon]
MKAELAHSQVEAKRFLNQFQSAFTTRWDGSTWPNWERTWRNADRYVRGLFRPGTDNTVTDIAEKTHMDQERLERFIRKSPWEHGAVEARLQEIVPDAVQGDDTAIVVDGMGIPKKGDDSVGVARQWCGATGKIDNCQVTVNATLARPGERRNADQVTWPLGMRLYLDKEWTGHEEASYDNQRERERYARLREKTDIPDDARYQPKYDIAAGIIDRAVGAGLDHACVVADSNFGKRNSFRQELRAMDEPYVLEIETGKPHIVPEETSIIEPGPTEGRGPPRKYPTYPEDVTAETPAMVADRVGDLEAWSHITWNEGTKDELSGDFYRERVRVVKSASNRWLTAETGWLLLKRVPEDNDSEETYKAWLCWGLDDASLEDLVSWAQLRWTIEKFHREIKQELGGDEYQGRTWRGFHHHLSAVMLAHAFIAKLRLETGTDRSMLSSFETIVREIVRESATQRVMTEHGLTRAKAEEIAVDMLEGYSSW